MPKSGVVSFFEIVSNTLSIIFFISTKYEVDTLAEVITQIFENLDGKVDHESRPQQELHLND